MILPHSPAPKAATKAGWARPLLLLLASVCLIGSLFLPLWRITLDAPQYPEGMGMLIWSRNLTGENPHDLDIINQLNHYIGMKPIVPEAIPELRLIAPLTVAFAVLCLLAAFRPRLWAIALLLGGLSAAGAVGMYDFWRWEYAYGHDLDPKAAIQVPGASFQPPLIGTAQILNFHSSSWPAAGAYLLFAAGGLLALALLHAGRETLLARRALSRASGPSAGNAFAALIAAASVGLSGCQSGPAPIHWGEDACHHCKMTLVQKGFAAQRVNSKGKAFKYDAIECLAGDLAEHPGSSGDRLYVSDLSDPDAPMLPAESATYLKGGRVASPMGGGLAGFSVRDSALAYQSLLGGELRTWQGLGSP